MFISESPVVFIRHSNVAVPTKGTELAVTGIADPLINNYKGSKLVRILGVQGCRLGGFTWHAGSRGRRLARTLATTTRGCQRQQARALPQQDRLVRLSVLLVHDHVDDGVDARGQVQHNIAKYVYTCNENILYSTTVSSF